ncbi:hypothetical protein [Blautia massiliensis (ex Durand et al. 2017)]|uniref:hypothetical protein n=1 Tax=Blautia massiliensis (ex Durand et al. 2017) TaxID=1737424 RepID=UPI0018A025FE|nr:hypothetical protein [Blautia massiliensis (ex Durand et al. 2017)]
MMTKAEEMKIRLDYINDVQELKDIILQQAKEIDDFKKYSAKYDEALINAENERLKYLEQLSENARLQVKLTDAEFHAYMHEKCARTALEIAKRNKIETNIIV